MSGNNAQPTQSHHRRPPDVNEALSSMLWTPYERTPTDSSSDDDDERLNKQLRKSQSAYDYQSLRSMDYGQRHAASVSSANIRTIAATVHTATANYSPYVPFTNIIGNSCHYKSYESSAGLTATTPQNYRNSYPYYGGYMPGLHKWWSSSATVAKEPPSYESLYAHKCSSTTTEAAVTTTAASTIASTLVSSNVPANSASNQAEQLQASNCEYIGNAAFGLVNERLVSSFTDNYISMHCSSASDENSRENIACDNLSDDNSLKYSPHSNSSQKSQQSKGNACTTEVQQQNHNVTNAISKQSMETSNHNNKDTATEAYCAEEDAKAAQETQQQEAQKSINNEQQQEQVTALSAAAPPHQCTNEHQQEQQQEMKIHHQLSATMPALMNETTATPTTTANALQRNSPAKNKMNTKSKTRRHDRGVQTVSSANSPLHQISLPTTASVYRTLTHECHSESRVNQANRYRSAYYADYYLSDENKENRQKQQLSDSSGLILTPNKCLAELERLYAEFRASESLIERQLNAAWSEQKQQQQDIPNTIEDNNNKTMRLNIPATTAATLTQAGPMTSTPAASPSNVISSNQQHNYHFKIGTLDDVSATKPALATAATTTETTTGNSVYRTTTNIVGNFSNNNISNNNISNNHNSSKNLTNHDNANNVSVLAASPSLMIQVNNHQNNNNNNSNHNNVANNQNCNKNLYKSNNGDNQFNNNLNNNCNASESYFYNSNNHSQSVLKCKTTTNHDLILNQSIVNNNGVSVVNCNYSNANNFSSNNNNHNSNTEIMPSSVNIINSSGNGCGGISDDCKNSSENCIKNSSINDNKSSDRISFDNNSSVTVPQVFHRNHKNNAQNEAAEQCESSNINNSVNIINVNTTSTNEKDTTTITNSSKTTTTPPLTPTRTFTSTECQTDDDFAMRAQAAQATPSAPQTTITTPTREQRRRERRERRRLEQQHAQNHRRSLDRPIPPPPPPHHHHMAHHLHPAHMHHPHLPGSPGSMSALLHPMLPDILHSHFPPPYSALSNGGVVGCQHPPPAGSLLGPPMPPPSRPPPPPPGATILTPVISTVSCGGSALTPPIIGESFHLSLPIMRRSPSERSGKGCCGQWFAGPPLRALIAVVALGGVACALGGAALGATGLAGPPSSHLTAALLMIGVGVILVTVSGAAWRMTAPGGGQTCLGLGSGVDLGRCGRRPCSRGGGAPHGLLYPEFQHRPPPPSYQASMQEYRLRLLLLDRDRQNGVVRGSSPPPTYRSHAGSLLRAPLTTTIRGAGGNGGNSSSIGGSEYSLPPSYRSRNATPATLSMERTIETAPSGRLLANEDIPEPSSATEQLPDYSTVQLHANTTTSATTTSRTSANLNRNHVQVRSATTTTNSNPTTRKTTTTTAAATTTTAITGTGNMSCNTTPTTINSSIQLLTSAIVENSNQQSQQLQQPNSKHIATTTVTATSVQPLATDQQQHGHMKSLTNANCNPNSNSNSNANCNLNFKQEKLAGNNCNNNNNGNSNKSKELVTIVTISQGNNDVISNANRSSSAAEQIDILAHL